MANRTPRTVETRENGTRQRSWQRQSMLPTPNHVTDLSSVGFAPPLWVRQT